MSQQMKGMGGQGSAEDMRPEEIAEMLFRALMNADEAMMAAMARAPSPSLQAWNQAARWEALTTCTERFATSI